MQCSLAADESQSKEGICDDDEWFSRWLLQWYTNLDTLDQQVVAASLNVEIPADIDEVVGDAPDKRVGEFEVMIAEWFSTAEVKVQQHVAEAVRDLNVESLLPEKLDVISNEFSDHFLKDWYEVAGVDVVEPDVWRPPVGLRGWGRCPGEANLKDESVKLKDRAETDISMLQPLRAFARAYVRKHGCRPKAVDGFTAGGGQALGILCVALTW